MNHSGHHYHHSHATLTPDADGNHSMHDMTMYFHFGTSETVLFSNWSFTSIGPLIGSMVAIFFMSALYEGLKYYREYLFWKTYNALQYRAVSLVAEKRVVSEDNQVVQMVGEVIHALPPSTISPMHFLHTLLYIIQTVLSYFLMLIFMTYNVWLCLAVVLGAAFGYFLGVLSGWKKSVIVDVTEHCH